MSDMWEYEPGIVYENLIRMMEYRGAALVNPALDPAAVQLRMNQHGYATISAVRAVPKDISLDMRDPRGDAYIHMVLIAPGHDYASKSPKFKNLLVNLPVATQPLEIIVITSDGITPHIRKVIEEHNMKTAKVIANRKPNETVVNTGTIYEYDYSHFVIETPKHNSCELHEIMTTAYVAEFCDKYYMAKEDFSKITAGDSQAIWLGLRPGMVVKVTRSSKCAGVSTTYRTCTR